MSPTYLRACILCSLLAGCSSSTKVSVDGSVPPTKFDSGGPDIDSNVPPAGRDSSVMSGDVLAPAIEALAPSIDVVGPYADDAKDGLTGEGGSDANTDTIRLAPDVPSDSKGSADVYVPLPDAASDAPVEVSKPANDGGLGPGCIKALFSTYIVRRDGILVSENAPSDPQTVVEESTGRPLTGIVNMQEGQYHGCAALANGTAECWQFFASSGNFYGQLGNGTRSVVSTAFRATPVLTGPATPLTNVVAVATGDCQTNSACAITSDTQLWCWGDLSWIVRKGTGTLSTGYAQAITTDGAAPLTGVVSAARGPRQACAIVAGAPNTLWCWGSNVAGELGQGDTKARQYPTQVLGVTNPTKVVLAATYNDATACVTDGGNVKCWGVSGSGATGANVTTNFLSPTMVVDQSGAPLDSVIDIVPGGTAFAVLRSGGTMWTWGKAYQRYAEDYGPTDVVAIGWAGPPDDNGPRFLTGNGVYHNATNTVAVNCL